MEVDPPRSTSASTAKAPLQSALKALSRVMAELDPQTHHRLANRRAPIDSKLPQAPAISTAIGAPIKAPTSTAAQAEPKRGLALRETEQPAAPKERSPKPNSASSSAELRDWIKWLKRRFPQISLAEAFGKLDDPQSQSAAIWILSDFDSTASGRAQTSFAQQVIEGLRRKQIAAQLIAIEEISNCPSDRLRLILATPNGEGAIKEHFGEHSPPAPIFALNWEAHRRDERLKAELWSAIRDHLRGT